MLIVLTFIQSGYTVSIELLYLLVSLANSAMFNALHVKKSSLLFFPSLVRYLRNLRNPLGKIFSPFAAGIEIGFWSFVVNTLQIFVLRCIPASCGDPSVFNQLSSVILPCTSACCSIDLSVGVLNFMVFFLYCSCRLSFNDWHKNTFYASRRR